MKKITLLLVAAIAMVFSTAFANAPVKAGKAVGAGKMKASVSAGFKMISPKEGDSTTKIDFAQLGAYSFLSPQSAGLSFAYGITNDMHVALSMPVFSMTSMPGDISMNHTFGAPKLGFVYAKNVGAVEVTAAPYIALPFMEMMSMTANDTTVDSDRNFDQPIAFGLNLAVDSAPSASKIFWGVWMNLGMSLEKKDGDVVTDAKSMMMNMSALVGYKINPKMKAKFQLYYDTPNLQDDAEGAAGFADGNIKMKLHYGMKLNETSGLGAGLVLGMGTSDKSSMHEQTLFGLIVDYSIAF